MRDSASPSKILIALLSATCSVLLVASPLPALAQCPAVAPDLATELRCVAHRLPSSRLAVVDSQHRYTLSELIDLAESSHPSTRGAWEQARAAAEREGLARSEYLPHLAGLATFLNQKFINPFPKPYAPRGYTMVEMPVAEGGLTVGYTLLDFGRRHAHLEAARAQALAEAAHFERENQKVAFAVVTAYYRLTDAQQTLAARQQILATARTIQSAAEEQLAHGQATLPDVLDARAGTAHAEYELEQAVGEEQTARVELRESLGVPPSDQIQIQDSPATDTETQSTESATTLVEEALKMRPDLAAFSERLRAAGKESDAARSEYMPTIAMNARGSAQALWPTVSKDGGSYLTDTAHFVWEAGITIHWNFFDGGARRSQLALAQAEQRKVSEEQREALDEVTRATWTAWVGYRTATRRLHAAQTLFTAADSSYQASLDAYHYGVKNLIDLVHAEQQLAEARLAVVEARSALQTASANLGYTTGTLLRSPMPNQNGDQK